jgi:hypothetical protein
VVRPHRRVDRFTQLAHHRAERPRVALIALRRLLDDLGNRDLQDVARTCGLERGD